MQPVFFISLFSLIFLMFSSMTAGLSKNIMQANIERTSKTYEIFNNVELALTKMAFKEKKVLANGDQKSIVDLIDTDLTDLGGVFLAEHTSFTNSELEYDPWRRKIFLLMYTEEDNSARTIWGGPGGQYARAPITTFMLVSAGANQYYDLFDSWSFTVDQSTNSRIVVTDASSNPSKNDILLTDITDKNIVNDDIIIRFSNYDALLDVWQRAEDLDTIVKNVSMDYYKNLLDAFSPLIQLTQRDTTEGLLSNDIFSDLDSLNAYSAFESLEDSSDTSFTNEWNNPGPLHDILNNNYRVAKKYGGEFTIAPEVLDKFNNEFGGQDFLYPSFDAIIKDDNGTNLAPSQQGLHNLGVTNVGSLDPFEGLDGELSYQYNENEPNIVYIKRKVSVNSDKTNWEINKLQKIDGLGAL